MLRFRFRHLFQQLLHLPARLWKRGTGFPLGQCCNHDTQTLGVWNVAKRRLSLSSSLSTTGNINIQPAFFTLLRLLRHYKETYSKTRDEAYASCEIAPVTKQDLQGLDQWMDLADAAYSEFPNDPTVTLQLPVL